MNQEDINENNTGFSNLNNSPDINMNQVPESFRGGIAQPNSQKGIRNFANHDQLNEVPENGQGTFNTADPAVEGNIGGGYRANGRGGGFNNYQSKLQIPKDRNNFLMASELTGQSKY